MNWKFWKKEQKEHSLVLPEIHMKDGFGECTFKINTNDVFKITGSMLMKAYSRKNTIYRGVYVDVNHKVCIKVLSDSARNNLNQHFLEINIIKGDSDFFKSNTHAGTEILFF